MASPALVAPASACLLLSGLLACLGAPARGPRVEVVFTGATMGTTYTIKVVADAEPPPARRLELEQAIRAALEDIDGKMSTWDPDSELSRLNRAAAKTPFPLSSDTFTVLEIAQAVSRESGGAFDVTVAPLVDAWGFGPAERAQPPTPEEVAQLLRRVGFGLLDLDRETGTITKAEAGVQCDLSAIAKGYAVDRVASALLQIGAASFLVEVGGEIQVRGDNRHQEPWRLAVERPTSARRTVQRVLPVSEGGLATSGDYRNFYVADGRRYSHTIDPRSGAPVAHRLASVSVLHRETVLADAWATALMVLGPVEGLRFADERNLAALFLVYRDGGGVDERMTPSLQRFLDAGGGAVPISSS